MENNKNLEHKRHTLAHLLAQAVVEQYPNAKLTLGPAVDNGFYYDIDFCGEKINDTNLPKIEKSMRKNLSKWKEFNHEEVSVEKAKKFFNGNEYKLELIDEIVSKKEIITLYACGGFTDLCRGGHTENPAKEIDSDSFKLDRVAGAYWRGDEKNPMVIRIYGLAFNTKTELEKYILEREEAEKRDHRKLGKELDLFTFSPLIGSGLPLWTPKGTILRDLLGNFVFELRAKHGYEKVDIPHITKKALYEKSGHWEKFQNDLFKVSTREGHGYVLKPMNCPHHTQIYARKQWSYRELPQRYASTTKVYRDEQSGELAGLSRVLSITQDDAHVFCRSTQVKAEMSKIWDIIVTFYGVVGFTLVPRLSIHDPKQMEKYLGTEESWQNSERELRELVDEKKFTGLTIEAIGEAAFYGPKIDFMAKDSLGREWPVATIQLDSNMPERFDLDCINEKSEKERVVMIHAAIMGSIERYLSILIEHLAGCFPLWLSPVQVSIVPVLVENHLEYAKKVLVNLHGAGIRAEINSGKDSLGKRINHAKAQKTPCVIVIGDKEVASEALTVEKRSGEKLENIPLEQLIANLKSAVEQKKENI